MNGPKTSEGGDGAAPGKLVPPVTAAGCWAAYYHDQSAAYVFGSEIEALRFAVEFSCAVHFVEWGSDVFRAKP